MLDADDIERINRGFEHCVVRHPMELVCEKCNMTFSVHKMTHGDGLPIWALCSLIWGFAKQHSDCGVEDLDDSEGA